MEKPKIKADLTSVTDENIALLDIIFSELKDCWEVYQDKYWYSSSLAEKHLGKSDPTLYEHFWDIYRRSGLVKVSPSNTIMMNQNGLEFDSFKDEKNRQLGIESKVRKLEEREEKQWFLKKGHFALSIVAISLSLLALILPFTCNKPIDKKYQDNLNHQLDSLKQRILVLEKYK